MMNENTLIDNLLAIKSNGSTMPIPIKYDLLLKWSNRFHKDLKIGSGAFGDVYKGEVDRLGHVAIKQVSKQLSLLPATDKDDLIASLNREINVLSQFRHSNIIILLGYCNETIDGKMNLCLLYEYASLGTLSDYFNSNNLTKINQLTWNIRLQICYDIASALNYLHHNNTGNRAFHRDVKSANIVLTSNYVAKLIDCGLSKFIPSDENTNHIPVKSKTSQVFGTPGYQCTHYLRTSIYEAKSEIFSFGIVLAEIFTGSLQGKDGIFFEDYEEFHEVLDACKDLEVAWSIDLAKELQKLIKECISIYKKRISNMTDILRRLKDLCNRFLTSPIHPNVDVHIIEEINQIKRENELLKQEVNMHRVPQMDCINCCDQFASSDLYNCPNNHSLCCDCFRHSVYSQIRGESKVKFQQLEGKVYCSYCGFNDKSNIPLTCISLKELAIMLNECDYCEYQKVLSEIKEVDMASRLTRQVREEVKLELQEEGGRNVRIQKHKQYVLDDLLWPKCPNCSKKFALEFGACFAVTCGGVNRDGCMHEFCAWCLGCCTAPSNDSHTKVLQHIKQCKYNPKRNDIYGNMNDWYKALDKSQVIIRTKMIKEYLQNITNEKDRKLLVNTIAKDLEEKGIPIREIGESIISDARSSHQRNPTSQEINDFLCAENVQKVLNILNETNIDINVKDKVSVI